MNPEDRIRAAFGDRAARARTSPDALDGVFRRVSRHRRNVRIAASLATASVVAVAAVAVAATRPSEDRFVVQPTPTATTAPPVSTAPDRAYVLLDGDDHVVEVDTTTGAVLRDVVEAPSGAHSLTTDASRAVLAFETEGCDVTVVDTRTGATRHVSGGRPALSPDGRSIAMTDCSDGLAIVVTDLATGRQTRYAPRHGTSVPPDTIDVETLSFPVSLAWLDARHLAIARVYETAEDMLVLDLDADRSLSDAGTTGVAFAQVTARDGIAVGVETCCMPDWDKPTKVARLHAGQHEVLFATNPGDGVIATDHTGAVLYGDVNGLWRWDGGDAPRLLLRGNVVGVAG